MEIFGFAGFPLISLYVCKGISMETQRQINGNPANPKISIEKMLGRKYFHQKMRIFKKVQNVSSSRHAETSISVL